MMYVYTRAIDLAIQFGNESLAGKFVKEADTWGIEGVKVAGHNGIVVEVVCLAQHYRKVVKKLRGFAKRHGIRNASCNGEVIASQRRTTDK